MNKIARPKTTLKKMVEDKKKLVEYLITGDESKKPEGVEFVNPFTLPGTIRK